MRPGTDFNPGSGFGPAGDFREASAPSNDGDEYDFEQTQAQFEDAGVPEAELDAEADLDACVDKLEEQLRWAKLRRQFAGR